MMTATPTRQIAAPMRSHRSGRNPVDEHTPGERAGDEDATVGGQDAPEVRVGSGWNVATKP